MGLNTKNNRNSGMSLLSTVVALSIFSIIAVTVTRFVNNIMRISTLALEQSNVENLRVYLRLNTDCTITLENGCSNAPIKLRNKKNDVLVDISQPNPSKIGDFHLKANCKRVPGKHGLPPRDIVTVFFRAKKGAEWKPLFRDLQICENT